MEPSDKPIYGIWIPGSGWLRGQDVFADANIAKAREVARLIGRGARVRYIDPAIVDLEQHYLEAERRTLWHIFKSFFKRNGSK
jgi:hypothetical protein